MRRTAQYRQNFLKYVCVCVGGEVFVIVPPPPSLLLLPQRPPWNLCGHVSICTMIYELFLRLTGVSVDNLAASLRINLHSRPHPSLLSYAVSVAVVLSFETKENIQHKRSLKGVLLITFLLVRLLQHSLCLLVYRTSPSEFSQNSL